MKPRETRTVGLSKGQQLRMIGAIVFAGAILFAYQLSQIPVGGPVVPDPNAEPLDFAIRGHQPDPDGLVRVSMEGSAGGTELMTAEERADFEDNTVGLSRRELAHAAAIFGRLSDRSPAGLEADARSDASFTVLMQQPDSFRGELIELRGDLRRLVGFPGLETFDGPGELVEGWLFLSDAGNNPVRILAIEADATLPQGEQFEPEPVVVRGVFVKRFGYASRGGTSVAPLLLAQSIDRVPVAPAEQVDEQWPALVIFVAVIVMTIAAISLRSKVQRRRPAFTIAGAENADGAQNAAGGNVDTTVAPEDFLDQLSRDAAAATGETDPADPYV